MRAKARGVRFGRKLKLTKHQQQEALARREAGEALTGDRANVCGEPRNDFEASAWGRLIGSLPKLQQGLDRPFSCWCTTAVKRGPLLAWP